MSLVLAKALRMNDKKYDWICPKHISDRIVHRYRARLLCRDGSVPTADVWISIVLAGHFCD